MGIRTSKVVQTFKCDGCDATYEYNQPTHPGETLTTEVADKLKKIVAVSDPASGQPPFETLYHDDDARPPRSGLENIGKRFNSSFLRILAMSRARQRATTRSRLCGSRKQSR